MVQPANALLCRDVYIDRKRRKRRSSDAADCAFQSPFIGIAAAVAVVPVLQDL